MKLQGDKELLQLFAVVIPFVVPHLQLNIKCFEAHNILLQIWISVTWSMITSGFFMQTQLLGVQVCACSCHPIPPTAHLSSVWISSVHEESLHVRGVWGQSEFLPHRVAVCLVPVQSTILHWERWWQNRNNQHKNIKVFLEDFIMFLSQTESKLHFFPHNMSEPSFVVLLKCECSLYMCTFYNLCVRKAHWNLKNCMLQTDWVCFGSAAYWMLTVVVPELFWIFNSIYL